MVSRSFARLAASSAQRSSSSSSLVPSLIGPSARPSSSTTRSAGSCSSTYSSSRSYSTGPVGRACLSVRSRSSWATTSGSPAGLAARLLSSSPPPSTSRSTSEPAPAAATLEELSESERMVKKSEQEKRKYDLDSAQTNDQFKKLHATEQGREFLDNMSIPQTVYYYPEPWYKGPWEFHAMWEKIQFAYKFSAMSKQELQRSVLKRKEDEISTFIISLTPSEFRARRKAKKELAAELELAFKKFRLEQIRAYDSKAIAAVCTGTVKQDLIKKAQNPSRSPVWQTATWEVAKTRASPKLLCLLSNPIAPGFVMSHALARFDYDEVIHVGGKSHNQRLRTVVAFEKKVFGSSQGWKVKLLGVKRDPHGANFAHAG